MNYFITTDATCDLPKHYYKENFSVIPMAYIIDGIEYGIDKFLSIDDFYSKMAEGSAPTTTLINTYFAKDFFIPILKNGNDILHICFSSGLSGSFHNLEMAVAELKIEFPERTIMLIDSKSASVGEGLLVHYSLCAREEGMNIEDNYKYTLNLVDHLCHYFTVDDLNHLHRGGRVSKAQAVIGTMLKVKPILYCNTFGKLHPIDKVVSRKKALLAIIDKMVEKMWENNSVIFVAHANALNDAEFVANKIKEKTMVERIEIFNIGPVITAHAGLGTVGILFLGDDKKDLKDETIR